MRPLYNVRKLDTLINKHLTRNGIMLNEYDVIAGGMVRDLLLGRKFNDIDVYSPCLDNSDKLLISTPGAEVIFKNVKHENFHGRNYIYAANKVTVDHKFYDPDGPYMTTKEIAGLFRCSICQIAYNKVTGVYMSADFQRALHTNEITFDSRIPNWNVDDNKGENYHANKIKQRFTDFKVNVIGAADTVNTGAFSGS